MVHFLCVDPASIQEDISVGRLYFGSFSNIKREKALLSESIDHSLRKDRTSYTLVYPCRVIPAQASFQIELSSFPRRLLNIGLRVKFETRNGSGTLQQRFTSKQKPTVVRLDALLLRSHGNSETDGERRRYGERDRQRDRELKHVLQRSACLEFKGLHSDKSLDPPELNLPGWLSAGVKLSSPGFDHCVNSYISHSPRQRQKE